MTIKWSYRAQQQQDNTADYIFREFGSKAVVEFYNKLDKSHSCSCVMGHTARA